MSKTISETRFEKSRKRLSQALRDLEEVVKDKIHETAINSKMIDVVESGLENANAKIIEQEAIIQNLSEEINDLQNNLSILGNEVDAVDLENKNLSSNLKKIQKETKKIIEEIEADLLEIEEVINDN